MKTIISSQRTSLSFDYENQRKLMKEERFAGKQNSAGEMGHRIAKHVYTSANVLEKSTYYVLDATGKQIAVYERNIDENTQSVAFQLTERTIYGTTRVGSLNKTMNLLVSAGTATYVQATVNHSIGKRSYELANHLGSVITVVSDKVIPHPSVPVVTGSVGGGSTVDYWLADILQSSDYSPFGVTLKNRSLSKSGVTDFVRFGYQGSEMDNELKNGANSYTTFFRQLDPRLGRWLSLDPKAKETPFESPFVSMNNTPIRFNDVLGDVPTPKEAALMARHAYGGDKAKTTKLKGGWKVSSIDLGNDFTKSDPSGLKAQIYERTKKGKTEYAIVYAGTEDAEDWGDNISQPLGSSKQYDLAIKNAIAVNDKIKFEVTYVGHSLGGGLATLSALYDNKAAVTFNPAWVGTVTLTKYGLWTNWTNSNNINNYVVAGEALDESMRLLRTTTGLVVQTGNTHFLFTWKNFVYPQDVINSHYIEYLIWEMRDVDTYNKVYNAKTGKNEVDK